MSTRKSLSSPGKRQSTKISESEVSRILTLMGKKIAAFRKDQGLTIDSTAHDAGIQVCRYEAIESGSVDPSLFELYELARCLKVSITTLISGI